jgi:thioredoxin reductase
METNHDYLIIGAGPAGLQLAYYLQKNNRNYLILERAANAGAFFETYPRHRQMISINKVHTGKGDSEVNLRWDWNSLLSDEDQPLFKQYSQRYFPDAEDLCRYLVDFAARNHLRIRYNTEVLKVSRVEQGFVVCDAQGNEFSGKRLIVATGLFKPYIPDIPGIDLCDNYSDHEINPKAYTNKRVLIVGKGNSAFETANNLVETAAVIHICSPESVRFAWQTHFVGNLRAVNNDFLDTYQLKSQNTVIDATITKIERGEMDQGFQVHIAYSHASGQTAVVPYDHVIVCTGFRFDSSIFDDGCRPELFHMDKLPAQTAEWESTNVPGLYFAGTLMQACDYKKTMSGFIHGFRHNIKTLSRLFEAKYHDRPWSGIMVEATPESILDLIMNRINNGPGIFLQPGFLQDLIVVSDQHGTAEYFRDIRADYIHRSAFGQNDHYYTISLEYGHFMGDPFSVERDPDPERGQEAAYLHPVIRRFDHGLLVAQHHIQDDLESEWFKDVYVQPALAFFQQQLRATARRELLSSELANQ